uniref:Protein FAM50 homolog n=1 Tax=Steinernema glaseri TaxID=37863 RepID=A0A1I7Z011_9BILA
MSHADGERAKEDAELRLQQLEEERKNVGVGITTKFTANYDAIEETLKSKTVGLVTLDEMREKQKDAVVQREHQIATENYAQEESSSKISAPKEEKSDCQKRLLSFAFDDEEEDEEEVVVPPKKRLGMDPTVDTSFLPDREREGKVAQLREQLATEWRTLQEREKNEDINVAYCYWDGSSHRKDMRMQKGNTISQFLTKAIEVLKKEFTELKTATSESLMFVKEDLIIPHFYTFQDFIATKAMGKTGPLWQFDAAGEIRVRQDAALDCGEAHPAKVVLRSWFERNKHIYPASRWEAFVPNKVYKNTIDDLSTI